MRRDPCTGLYYPYYEIVAWVWDETRHEYNAIHVNYTQDKKTAITIVKNMTVDADRSTIEIFEENYGDCECIAIKEAYDGDPSYGFYDPRTYEDIE